jgi:hypothetical protein
MATVVQASNGTTILRHALKYAQTITEMTLEPAVMDFTNPHQVNHLLNVWHALLTLQDIHMGILSQTEQA